MGEGSASRLLPSRSLVLADRTNNLHLGSDGERHYCCIPILCSLYFHTKSAYNMPHMCKRCVRSFKTKEVLEKHFQWCPGGLPQIEKPPNWCQEDKKFLSRKRRNLRVLTNPGTSVTKKRKILTQRGEIIPALIPIIAASINAASAVGATASHAAISKA